MKNKLDLFNRESGVLLHPTSLPGPYGIGDMGPNAYQFVDQLCEMGQSLWQILPLIDTGFDICPYNNISAFANNTLLISYDILIEDGYLIKDDLPEPLQYRSNIFDHNLILNERTKIFDLVCDRFSDTANNSTIDKYASFCLENSFWLENYTLFKTIKHINNDSKWTNWTSKQILRDDDEIEKIKKKYYKYIKKIKILQFLFHDQWVRLKKYANDNGIKIIGDLPIYISHDSADVWAYPDLFKLTENGNIKFQSGCPPDVFVSDGQMWGHPVYNWDVHERTNYKWWIERFKAIFNTVDIVRIDHFNGFAKYWEIPAGHKNGSKGKWVEGPGDKIFHAINKSMGLKPIIAEDLGDAWQEAKTIRDNFNIPGMKILQMSFGVNGESKNSIIKDIPNNIVVYTGTHDNDTAIGWFQKMSDNGENEERSEIMELEKSQVLDIIGANGSEINWDLITLALDSNANTSIIPLQDILGLDSKARMNIPGTIEGNWSWRFNSTQLTREMMERMNEITKHSNRI